MDHSLIDTIAGFINSTGIPCRPSAISGDTFLPGIAIENGCILYDPERLKYPGDLLHEAGHLAILLPEDRATAQFPDKMFGDVNKDGAEISAIAWSWAALRHLQIDPAVLFHEGGYRDGSASLIENFSEGKYIGVPLLRMWGMTNGGNSNNAPGKNCYPDMIHWLRQG